MIFSAPRLGGIWIHYIKTMSKLHLSSPLDEFKTIVEKIPHGGSSFQIFKLKIDTTALGCAKYSCTDRTVNRG